LALIYTEAGQHHEATDILEHTYLMNQDNEDIGRDLFYSYVRENKLLKQQNHALMLYKHFEHEIYALWAVETMYLIKLSIKNFETKILDIAYLLLLKVMKHPDFEMDRKFVILYLKVLNKQGNFREALEFVESKKSFFPDKIERQEIEADLYLKAEKTLESLNTYYQILKSNSHLANFKEMWPTYQKAIRVLINHYIKKNYNFEFKGNLDYTINHASIKTKPFDPIEEDMTPMTLLESLLSSIVVLKKNIIVDNPKTKAIANSFRMTLSRCEIEYKF
jgi:tetratricopeptide (TPR) repeat protein